jgi:hypothetical protein
MVKKFWLSIGLLTLIYGCTNSSEFKTVHTEQAGEYTVTVLSETGSIKNGASDFVLEFRRTADNQPVDVGSVDVAPVMEMPGMGPMIGSTTITPGDAPGRYNVKSNLSMAGQWKFNVKFGDGQSVRMNLTAE